MVRIETRERSKLMRPKLIHETSLLWVISSLAWLPVPIRAEPSPKTSRPFIYDESADAVKQIADALARARKEGKRVLLQFGANWCGWCHKLHKLFETNRSIADELKSHYVIVMVDVNNGHNQGTDAKYGNPTRFGLPVMVVLDSEGKPLTTQETGILEEGDLHDPKKVLALLKEWTPGK